MGLAQGGVDNVVDATKAGYDTTMNIASPANSKTKDVASLAYDTSKNAFTDTKYFSDEKVSNANNKIHVAVDSAKQYVDSTKVTAEGQGHQ